MYVYANAPGNDAYIIQGGGHLVYSCVHVETHFARAAPLPIRSRCCVRRKRFHMKGRRWGVHGRNHNSWLIWHSVGQ